MLFEIHAERNANDKQVFIYDNETNVLVNSAGVEFKFSDVVEQLKQFPVRPFNKDFPLKKSDHIAVLKIQLGLSCNYSCDYCSQKFVERPESTSAKDIEAFMKKLEVLKFHEENGLRVEFWGGEPLVYWKTLKPLAEAIRAKIPYAKFSMITNGSILTKEICDWLIDMDFTVSISHDGPGQSVRGPDPFEDPEKKELVKWFYRRMVELKKGVSFNSMLSRNNMSRKTIHDWFVNFMDGENVSLGEGGIVDAYDEDGINNSLQTKQEHFEFRRQALKDILSTDGDIGFCGQIDKIDRFTRSVLAQNPHKYLGQKCGMDSEHVLAVDLHGNVLTCQNVSASEISKNGESHKGGNLSDYSKVEIKTSTHWSNRPNCYKCPVLHLCKGSCMFLEDKFWQTSCDNAYSDNVVLFVASMHKMTGYIPTLIKSEGLPLERQDIFGTIFEHKEDAPRKIIPIKVIADKVNLDNIEVYGQSRVAS